MLGAFIEGTYCSTKLFRHKRFKSGVDIIFVDVEI